MIAVFPGRRFPTEEARRTQRRNDANKPSRSLPALLFEDSQNLLQTLPDFLEVVGGTRLGKGQAILPVRGFKPALRSPPAPAIGKPLAESKFLNAKPISTSRWRYIRC